MKPTRVLCGIAASVCLCISAQAQVVISQIYFQGGEGTCPPATDYVEIHNRGATTVEMTSSWALYYRPAGVSSWTRLFDFVETVHFLPGAYKLFGPGPFQAHWIASEGGTVALINNDDAGGTAIPDGTCPTVGVVDLVGWGTSTCFEASGFEEDVSTNCTESIQRLTFGCVDTNVNSADFQKAFNDPRTSDSTISPDFHQCSDAVEISQVYTRSGTSSSVYNQRFIELRNSSHGPLALDGWSLQFQSSGSTNWGGVIALSGTISAGDYFVVASPSSGQGAPLPPGANQISASITPMPSGKYALVRNSIAPLPAGCNPANYEDLVGFGSAPQPCREGTANAPGITPQMSIRRLYCGHSDTQDNAADFESAPVFPRMPGSMDAQLPAFCRDSCTNSCTPWNISFLQQPQGQCLIPGINVTLSVSVQVASTELPCQALASQLSLQYWWYKNGVLISPFGGTNSLNFPSIAASDSGVYQVLVWTPCFQALSDPATVTVSAADFDGDIEPDVCDSDDDNDGVPDASDLCPMTPLFTPVDANGCPSGACCLGNGNCQIKTSTECAAIMGATFRGVGTTCPPTPLCGAEGDANGSGGLDADDISCFTACHAVGPTAGCDCAFADLDGDGDLDIDDEHIFVCLSLNLPPNCMP